MAICDDANSSTPAFAPELVFPLGDGEPTYLADEHGSLGALAEAAHETPAETFVRMTRESRGTALFTVRFFNRSLQALQDLLGSDHVLPGLGDAGAHVGQVMDDGWTTFFLSHWVRDRGLFGLPEGVRRLTSAPAELLGSTDRGRIEPGPAADINVIDLDRLAPLPVEYVHDFPGGAGRFVQRAAGYRATLVDGELILENDHPTGARAGIVLRGSIT